jgi:hypothetical protein
MWGDSAVQVHTICNVYRHTGAIVILDGGTELWAQLICFALRHLHAEDFDAAYDNGFPITSHTL